MNSNITEKYLNFLAYKISKHSIQVNVRSKDLQEHNTFTVTLCKQ